MSRKPKAAPEPDFKRKSVSALTLNQRYYVRNVKSHIYNFAIGPAGTGKTHIAIGSAVQAIRLGDAERIVITRPAVSMGRELGHLPGHIDAKMAPYVVPCFDELNFYLSLSAIREWRNSNKITVVPVPFLRGRSFHDSIMVMDEAQNATADEIKTFVARLGQRSRLVVAGDPDQSDLPPSQQGGLLDIIGRVEHLDTVSVSELTLDDVVRSDHGAEILEYI